MNLALSLSMPCVDASVFLLVADVGIGPCDLVRELHPTVCHSCSFRFSKNFQLFRNVMFGPGMECLDPTDVWEILNI